MSRIAHRTMDTISQMKAQMKAQHPDLYEDYVETTESRVFKLKKVET